LCEHKNQKAQCRQCNAMQCNEISFCIHNKYKRLCVKCGGKALCKSGCLIHDQKNIMATVYSVVSTYADKKNLIFLYKLCIVVYKEISSFELAVCCPDIKVSRNYKTKEKTVTDFFLEQFPNFTWIQDKRVQDGYSKRRPDLLLDLGYQVIIIEIDENEHKAYDCSRENKRIMELSQYLNHRPIVMHRFNPDGYIDNTGKKIISPWSALESEILTVKRTGAKEWQKKIR
jgi:hypothetical protein